MGFERLNCLFGFRESLTTQFTPNIWE